MKNLGLIGVGAWGQRYIQTIARRPDCRIGVLARASQSGSRSPAVPDAVWCQDVQEVLVRARRGEIDGMIVATTPDSQAEIAQAAIYESVPVLAEKPLGSSRFAAKRVCDAFRDAASKPPVLVNYVHLWAPAYRTLESVVRERCAAGQQIVSVSSAGWNRGPFRRWPTLDDYGSHDVALCLDLLGSSLSWQVQEVRRLPVSEKGELYQVRLKVGDTSAELGFGNGASTKQRRFAVSLSSGRTLVYDDTRGAPFKLTDGDTPMAIPDTQPLDAVLTDFLEQISLWQDGRFPEQRGTAVLEFCVHVSGVLDEIGRQAERHTT